MHRALSVNEILASLTTTPPHISKLLKRGAWRKGFDADLVLDADPAADVRNLAKVACTVRADQIIYQK